MCVTAQSVLFPMAGGNKGGGYRTFLHNLSWQQRWNLRGIKDQHPEQLHSLSELGTAVQDYGDLWARCVGSLVSITIGFGAPYLLCNQPASLGTHASGEELTAVSLGLIETTHTMFLEFIDTPVSLCTGR